MSSEGLAAHSITVDVHVGRYLRIKRTTDVVLSVAALMILMPLLVTLALAIKLHSPGPVLFRQPRIGKDGKPFTFLKFRSMRVDADTAIHRAHMEQLIKNGSSTPANGKSAKMEKDPRITGLGRILRKTSLDELPQFINVLRGEMSLVGPRPPIPYEVELYQDWHKRRLEALPGITGWWQIKGRSRVSFDDMVRMDIYYIEHRSLWLDLKIIAMTPLAMLHGQGRGVTMCPIGGRRMTKVGVVGCGYWGPKLARNFHELPESLLEWVCDFRKERLEHMKKLYPQVRITSSYEELLESDVDAVVLATPVSSHCKLALRALRAGKHVMVEKPLAGSVAEGEAIVAEASRRGLAVMVGHTFVYNPDR